MLFAKAHKIEGSFEEVCKNKDMRIAVCKELDQQGRKAGLLGFENAKNVWLEPKPFADLGITTNTFKLQRFHAKKHYAEEIKQMYAEDMLPMK